MHLSYLLLLLVLLVANSNPVTSIEDESTISQTSSHRLLTDEVDAKLVELSSPKDDDPSGVANSESEERGFFTSAVSKIKSLFRKNPGLSSKLDSTRQNTEVVEAVAKMPIVKKLKTTMQKNPSFLKQLSNNPESLKKLAKDPQVAQVAAVMEKNNLKISKDSVNQLRSAAGKDPAKRRVLSVMDRIAEVGFLATFAGVALILVVASAVGIYVGLN